MIELNSRDIRALRFIADQKAVSYLHLGQYLDPKCQPAIDEPKDENKAKERGGNRRQAPWPRDRRKRLKAVSQLVDKWQKDGIVQKERPWLDRPQWVYVTMAGLRRLGLDYNDTFAADEEYLHHLYQVTRIRLLTERPAQEGDGAWFACTWISERAIKSRYPQNTPGITLPHLPDGVMELDEDAFVKMERGERIAFHRGDRIAVEVELSRKNFARLEKILPDLLLEYSGVWYFCVKKTYDAVIQMKQRLVGDGKLSEEQSKLIRLIHMEPED